MFSDSNHDLTDVFASSRNSRTKFASGPDLDHNYVLPFLGFFIEGEEMLPTLVSEWMERGTVDGYMQYFPRGGEETWNMVRYILESSLKCNDLLKSGLPSSGFANFVWSCLSPFQRRSSTPTSNVFVSQK